MGRVSINLVSIAVLAIMFLLCAATAPVLGRVATTSSEEKQLPVQVEYKLMLEERAAIRKAQQDIYQNQKIKMMNSLPNNILDVFESSKEEALQCVGQGSYCNFVFGPQCCSTDFACLPPGIFGGVCVA
ncbi:hypothetical protein SOVF_011920 [Spinacia oleracea]|uniref:Uncharacterized protein isoform X2 n=1 Tax=Spinacia oleracea TaxID=3562 RepID=A0A9R0K5X3_SPIOL|nr:uncharacterized protein LOC110798829 isoform X2 [Spinacia oleracea]KNA24832.1 hypothetical protein SOVF_011920 [Spinacia oleracea]